MNETPPEYSEFSLLPVEHHIARAAWEVLDVGTPMELGSNAVIVSGDQKFVVARNVNNVLLPDGDPDRDSRSHFSIEDDLPPRQPYREFILFRQKDGSFVGQQTHTQGDRVTPVPLTSDDMNAILDQVAKGHFPEPDTTGLNPEYWQDTIHAKFNDTIS